MILTSNVQLLTLIIAILTIIIQFSNANIYGLKLLQDPFFERNIKRDYTADTDDQDDEPFKGLEDGEYHLCEKNHSFYSLRERIKNKTHMDSLDTKLFNLLPVKDMSARAYWKQIREVIFASIFQYFLEFISLKEYEYMYRSHNPEKIKEEKALERIKNWMAGTNFAPSSQKQPQRKPIDEKESLERIQKWMADAELLKHGQQSSNNVVNESQTETSHSNKITGADKLASWMFKKDVEIIDQPTNYYNRDPNVPEPPKPFSLMNDDGEIVTFRPPPPPAFAGFDTITNTFRPTSPTKSSNQKNDPNVPEPPKPFSIINDDGEMVTFRPPPLPAFTDSFGRCYSRKQQTTIQKNMSRNNSNLYFCNDNLSNFPTDSISSFKKLGSLNKKMNDIPGANFSRTNSRRFLKSQTANLSRKHSRTLTTPTSSTNVNFSQINSRYPTSPTSLTSGKFKRLYSQTSSISDYSYTDEESSFSFQDALDDESIIDHHGEDEKVYKLLFAYEPEKLVQFIYDNKALYEYVYYGLVEVRELMGENRELYSGDKPKKLKALILEILLKEKNEFENSLRFLLYSALSSKMKIFLVWIFKVLGDISSTITHKKKVDLVKDFEDYLGEHIGYMVEKKTLVIKDEIEDALIRDLDDMKNYADYTKLQEYLNNSYEQLRGQIIKLVQTDIDPLLKIDIIQRSKKRINMEGWLRQLIDTDPLHGETYYSYMMRCLRRNRIAMTHQLVISYYKCRSMSNEFMFFPITHSGLILMLIFTCPPDKLPSIDKDTFYNPKMANEKLNKAKSHRFKVSS